MKRKLCRMSRGRNASARSRRRSSGQIYRAVTIPHAMKLNAMLTKNQIICCGMMNISFLEFEPWNGHTLLSDRGCKKLQPFADHSRADLPGRRADQHSWLDHDARFLLSASLVRHASH